MAQYKTWTWAKNLLDFYSQGELSLVTAFLSPVIIIILTGHGPLE